jgi:hypothetical protein
MTEPISHARTQELAAEHRAKTAPTNGHSDQVLGGVEMLVAAAPSLDHGDHVGDHVVGDQDHGDRYSLGNNRPAEVGEAHPLTDIANGERFVDQHGENVR